jgi:hypothetical protein
MADVHDGKKMTGQTVDSRVKDKPENEEWAGYLTEQLGTWQHRLEHISQTRACPQPGA